MAITINKELNVVSTGVPPVIHLSQYDSDFSLVFSLYASSGTLTMPNGTTAEIRGTKRDGNGYSASASVSGTTVTVTGDEQITACAGRNTFEIATYYNSKRLYTANFIIDVERAALDADTITSDTVLRELDAIIEGAEVAQEAAEAAEHSAAEAAAVVQSGIAITALQLMSSNYTSDSTPYLYRTTGGGAVVGTRELDEIVGGSVGWNQLVQNSGSDVVYSNGSTVDSKTNLSLYIQPMYGTNQPSINFGNFTSTGRYLKIGKAPSTSGYNMYYKHNGSTADIWIKASESKMYENHVYVFAFTLVGVNPSVVDGLKVQAPQITDLTLLLGSTIADYIYGLEQSTAGAGVAKLKEWGFFTEDYYAYDAGSLQSVTGVSAHEIVGKNLFDVAKLDFRETTTGGLTRVMQPDGTSFSLKGTSTTSGRVWGNPVDDGTLLLTAGTYIFSSTGHSSGLSLYFSDNTSQNEGTFTLAKDKVVTNVGIYVTNGASYNTIVYPLLRRAGTSDTYEPYAKHTYPLDSSLTLRGIPKLDSSNKLYFDGDVYQADGTVNRRYGIVDLGTLTWSYSTDSGHERFYATLSGYKFPGTGEVANIICSKYKSDTFVNLYNHVADKTIGLHISSNIVGVYDTAYSTAASFKTAVSGVYLVYELATPTTEQADPFAPAQICAEGGTEEYVTTGIVPVGHNTRYPADLAGKLDSIPALPTTAGNYRLKVTVTGGVPSYTWVSA